MKLATLVFLTLSPALAHASSVLTVGPGQMFSTLPAAQNVALPGDVLLLRTFSAVADFTGKGLTVVEDDLFSVEMEPLAPNLPITIQSIPAGETLTLSGLETIYPVQVSNCLGAVRLQNCRFNAGLSIVGCTDVRLADCQVRGRPPVSGFGHGSLALSIDGSGVVLDHTLVAGSSGANAGLMSSQFVPAGNGGDGLRVGTSTVLASGCTIQSGAGGKGYSGPCAGTNPPSPGGAAGHGLVVLDTTSNVSLLETSPLALAPGQGGFSNPFPTCLQPNGARGMDIAAPVGVVNGLSGSARWLRSRAISREGQMLHFDIAGQAGDTIVLAAADSSANAVTVFPNGSLAIQPPARRITLGTTGALGVIGVDVNVPELGVGVLSRVLHVQVVCIDATGQSWIGTPLTLTLLDSSL